MVTRSRASTSSSVCAARAANNHLTFWTAAALTRHGVAFADSQSTAGFRYKRATRRTLKAAMAPGVPGLTARTIAADILDGVLKRKRPLDEQIEDQAALRT